MKSIAPGIMLALLLMVSSATRPLEEVPAAEILLQPSTVKSLWDKSVEYAVAIASQPECQNLMFALTGEDPVISLTSPDFILTIPDKWPDRYEKYAAITTCVPRMMSIRKDHIEVDGPLYTALTVIHELAHVGTCDRVIEDDLEESAWEDMATLVERYCFGALASEQRKGR